MNKCTLEMPSYTYAQKAERLLRSKSIPSEIKRRNSGCDYILNIHADCRAATHILDKYGIPYVLRENSSSP